MVIERELKAKRWEIIEETGPRKENELGTDSLEAQRQEDKTQLRRCRRCTQSMGTQRDGEDGILRGSDISLADAPAKLVKPED